mgnify:CR=1 FL=1
MGFWQLEVYDPFLLRIINTLAYVNKYILVNYTKIYLQAYKLASILSFLIDSTTSSFAIYLGLQSSIRLASRDALVDTT